MDDESLRHLTEELLRPICAALKIDEDVSNLGFGIAREFADLFPDTEFVFVSGPGFERVALPSGSFLICAVTYGKNPNSFVELSPRNSALGDLLRSNWELLPDLPPVRLADFILTVQSIGTASHEVLANMSELDNPARRDDGFVLTDQAVQLAKGMPTSTSFEPSSEELSIHALTLHGWMHEKQNLGVTKITILNNGDVVIGERRTICDPVFLKMPNIWY